MIGQTAILNNVDYWIKTGAVPRFMIISGSKGSGRATLTKEITRRMKAYLIECELSVDAVREAVKNCYKCSAPTVYLFRNADKMSTAAKNAMLKITEEPPRQAHFVVTVQNGENMLETLRSRATNIQMAPYSADELDTFYHDYTLKHNRIIRDVCDVPGMMLEMEKIDVVDLIEFCNTIIDHIQEVTGVNAFKIVQRIRLKEEGNGYDPELFFHCMKFCLLSRLKEKLLHNDARYKMARMLKVTSKYHQEFNMTGIKKDATLDMWVLEMRNC
jgi:deoxyadenosine/deoxycytidine kinase